MRMFFLFCAVTFCTLSRIDAYSQTSPGQGSPGATTAPLPLAPIPRAELDSLMVHFTSDDWTKVENAASRLEFYQEAALPALIDLLDSDKRANLRNTLGVAFPGSNSAFENLYIDYFLNYLPARAGWMIERITFNNFSFSSDMVYSYTKNVEGKKGSELQERILANGVRRRIYEAPIRRAKAWWSRSAGRWTRYSGLLEALKCSDPIRQIRAVQWIRIDPATCDGLNPASFDKDILPLVRTLAQSKVPSVSKFAASLLEDEKKWWWKNKAGIQ